MYTCVHEYSNDVFGECVDQWRAGRCDYTRHIGAQLLAVDTLPDASVSNGRCSLLETICKNRVGTLLSQSKIGKGYRNIFLEKEVIY